MNHRRFFLSGSLIVIVLLATLLLGGVLLFTEPQTVWAQGGPLGAAYRGERLFIEHCTKCHGDLGKGDGPLADQAPVQITDFTDPAFGDTRSPQDVFTFIHDGSMENLMPPWGDSLSDEEIWDLVAYVWGLHIPEGGLDQGKLVYFVACEQCHGETGEGVADQGPALASHLFVGQSDNDLLASVQDPSHPRVEDVIDTDLQQAVWAVRSFSLGIGEQKPVTSGSGTITVRLSNGTTQENMPELPVRLLMFENESFSDTQEAVADAGGVAVFEQLPTDSAWMYVVETDYNNVTYNSDPIQFEAGVSTLEVPLTVYEMGATADDVRIGRAHWVISLESPNQVTVGELYVFMNTGDRVYLGEDSSKMPPEVLRLQFPDQATDLAVESGGSQNQIVVQGNTAIDSMPLPPGSRQVFFRYNLPVNDDRVQLGHVVPFATDFINLLVPDVGIQVEAAGWEAGDVLQTQSGNYLNFAISSLAAGATVEATLSNLAEAEVQRPVQTAQGGQQVIDSTATPGISGQPYLPYVLIIGSLLVLGGGTWLALRRRRSMLAEVPVLRQQMVDDLVAQIAELDDAFAEGDMDRTDYEAQRQMLKTRLAQLLQEEQSS